MIKNNFSFTKSTPQKTNNKKKTNKLLQFSYRPPSKITMTSLLNPRPGINRGFWKPETAVFCCSINQISYTCISMFNTIKFWEADCCYCGNKSWQIYILSSVSSLMKLMELICFMNVFLPRTQELFLTFWFAECSAFLYFI